MGDWPLMGGLLHLVQRGGACKDVMMPTNIFTILFKLVQAGLIRMYNSLNISFNCWH